VVTVVSLIYCMKRQKINQRSKKRIKLKFKIKKQVCQQRSDDNVSVYTILYGHTADVIGEIMSSSEGRPIFGDGANL